MTLRDFLRQRGLPAVLLMCTGYLGDPARLASYWQQQGWSPDDIKTTFRHFVVGLEGYVLDLTASQFGPERPVIVPFEDFVDDWAEIEELPEDVSLERTIT